MTNQVEMSKTQQSTEVPLDVEFEFNLQTKLSPKPALPDPTVVSSQNHEFRINVFTQFDPMKESMVGYLSETVNFPQTVGPPDNIELPLKYGKYPQFMAQQGRKSLDQIATLLKNQGVKVARVGKADMDQVFTIQGKSAVSFHCYSPRDVMICYHNSIYEAPSFMPIRSYEYRCFQWITNELIKKGNNVYEAKNFKSMFKPLKNEKEIKQTPPLPYYDLTHYKNAKFDAANILRAGLDLLYQISDSGNYAGYKYLRNYFNEKYDGKIRVHPIVDVYHGVHIDTSIVLLGFNKKVGKYVALVDTTVTTTPFNMPALLRGKNWTCIPFQDYNVRNCVEGYQFASIKLGLNLLSVNSQTVIMDSLQTNLKKVLEFYGYRCLTYDNTYGRQLGGGPHCMTNDYNRQDVHGFAKILATPKENLNKKELAGLFDPELLSFLEKEGDIEKWVEICNKNSIYPTYLTDYISKHTEAKL